MIRNNKITLWMIKEGCSGNRVAAGMILQEFSDYIEFVIRKNAPDLGREAIRDCKQDLDTELSQLILGNYYYIEKRR